MSFKTLQSQSLLIFFSLHPHPSCHTQIHNPHLHLDGTCLLSWVGQAWIIRFTVGFTSLHQTSYLHSKPPKPRQGSHVTGIHLTLPLRQVESTCIGLTAWLGGVDVDLGLSKVRSIVIEFMIVVIMPMCRQSCSSNMSCTGGSSTCSRPQEAEVQAFMRSWGQSWAKHTPGVRQATLVCHLLPYHGMVLTVIPLPRLQGMQMPLACLESHISLPYHKVCIWISFCASSLRFCWPMALYSMFYVLAR